jgi:signal peptidase I
MFAWSLLALYLIALSICLPRIFAKAGAPAWKGWMPLHNLVEWNRLLGKPWYWTILLLVPGINLLMLIIYNVNTSIAFGKRSLKDHVIMTLVPWVELANFAFKPTWTSGWAPSPSANASAACWASGAMPSSSP